MKLTIKHACGGCNNSSTVYTVRKEVPNFAASISFHQCLLRSASFGLRVHSAPRKEALMKKKLTFPRKEAFMKKKLTFPRKEEFMKKKLTFPRKEAFMKKETNFS